MRTTLPEAWFAEDAASVLAAWTFEQLIALAGQGQMPAAWAELERRSRFWRRPFVTWLARRGRLPEADIADAQAQAILAIREAAAKYTLGGNPTREEGRWKRFLKKVITGRVNNFVRSHRRVERGLDRHCQADDVAPQDQRHGRGADADPAQRAMRAEVVARLEQAIARLPELDRRVAAGLMEGKAEVHIAAELGITRGRIRGRIAKLGEWLGPYLRDLQEVLHS